jgi:hypothetical protein
VGAKSPNNWIRTDARMRVLSFGDKGSICMLAPT